MAAISFDDVMAWAYAVERKLGDRLKARGFLLEKVGVRRLRDVPVEDYMKLIAHCSVELDTTERPPSVDIHGNIINVRPAADEQKEKGAAAMGDQSVV